LGHMYSALVSILLRTFRAWVTCTTLGAEVLVTALRGATIAGTTVPLAADLIRPLLGFVDLFLFVGAHLIASSVILEVSGFDVSETSDIGELDVLNFSNIPTDGFVQVDNLGMRVGKGPEKLKYVLRIDSQFHGAVREGAQDCGESGVPSNSPVSVGLDVFQGLAPSNREVKLPDRGCGFIFGEGREESGEDDVEIDRRPRKDMFPFGFRERWEYTAGLQRP
jgi:hypothetical protein